MPENLSQARTLADLLKQQGHLPESQLIPIFLQVLKDLEFNHSQAQVHLDIKPSKIVRSRTGSFELIDYGMSRIGTVRYMSPERAQRKSTDGRSDIYSLGVVLYEAATGRAPFEGELNYEILDAHINKTPPLPRSVRPEVSGGLQRAILTALAKDPDDRFQSAGDFKRVLEVLRPKLAAKPAPAKPEQKKLSVTRLEGGKPVPERPVRKEPSAPAGKLAARRVPSSWHLSHEPMSGKRPLAAPEPKPVEKPVPEPELKPAAPLVQADKKPAAAVPKSGKRPPAAPEPKPVEKPVPEPELKPAAPLVQADKKPAVAVPKSGERLAVAEAKPVPAAPPERKPIEPGPVSRSEQRQTEKRRRRAEKRRQETEKKRPAPVMPVESKPAEPRAAQVRPTEARPTEPKPAAVKPGTRARRRKRVNPAVWLVPVAGVAVVAVVLLLALGRGSPQVPSLVGKSRADAVRLAGQAGLVLVTAGERDDTLPRGAVALQVPAPGVSVGKSDTVRVHLSTGVVSVPAVASLTLEDARRELVRMALRPGRIDSAYSDNHATGTVVRTTPGPGVQVKPHTTVVLAVASGRATCPACGKNRERGAKFCTGCGYEFE